MPIDWSRLQSIRSGKGLAPLSDGVRNEIEDQAARAIGLDCAASATVWGDAIGFGMYAAAVIRIRAAFGHRFGGEIAIKLYQNSANRFVQFHRDVMLGHDLEGVQRTIDVPQLPGIIRGSVILEYIAGDPLDECEIPAESIPALQARLFLRLLIPLWAAGHRFWDFRPANLIVSPERTELTMIDADSLLGSFERVRGGPEDWQDREAAEQLAFRRLPGCLAAFYPRDARTGMQRRIRNELHNHKLLDALHHLGRKDAALDEAVSAARECCRLRRW